MAIRHITRHGEFMTNIQADLESRFKINSRNNILTRKGVEQALEFGEYLKSQEPIEAIICSPYARTKQTAFLIASTLGTCVPIHYDRAFREIDWEMNGTFSRLEHLIDDFDNKSQAVDYKPLVDRKRRAITLESQKEVYERVVPAFQRVSAQYEGQNILIVCHFFVVRALQAWIHDSDPFAMTNYHPKNLCDVKITEAEIATRQNV